MVLEGGVLLRHVGHERRLFRELETHPESQIVVVLSRLVDENVAGAVRTLRLAPTDPASDCDAEQGDGGEDPGVA